MSIFRLLKCRVVVDYFVWTHVGLHNTENLVKSKQSLLLIKHSQCYSKSSEVKSLLRHLAKKQSQVQLPAKVESSYFSIMSIPSWLYRVLYVVSLKPTNLNIHQFCASYMYLKLFYRLFKDMSIYFVKLSFSGNMWYM